MTGSTMPLRPVSGKCDWGCSQPSRSKVTLPGSVVACQDRGLPRRAQADWAGSPAAARQPVWCGVQAAWGRGSPVSNVLLTARSGRDRSQQRRASAHAARPWGGLWPCQLQVSCDGSSDAVAPLHASSAFCARDQGAPS